MPKRQDLSISECRCIALLLQFEPIIADATGSIDREHERDCNVGLDRKWRLRLLLLLRPQRSRSEHQDCGKDLSISECRCIALLGDRFNFEQRGSIEVKGKGVMETFFLNAC